MIAQSTIDEILERASLVEIVGEAVPLKRAGRNYVGLCPFHTEKSPSFNVRESEGYFHCFGCGQSGNVVKFIMEMRGLSFPEAIEELAARYGIRVALEGGQTVKKPRSEKDLTYRVNQLAFEFFQLSLKKSSATVHAYLDKRHISTESVKSFGIGFAPLSWNELAHFLKSKNVPEDVLLQSTLVRRNDKGELYDIFRGRIIFPVWIDDRKIAGFGGRMIPSLFDEEAKNRSPKYLNSPESPVYQKSRLLYGLPQALPSIRELDHVYIVEGYMDVVGLSQAGVQNALATCGTALTESHVKRVSQLAHRVVVLFDGDTAGRTAAGKSFATFLNSGIDVSALFLPEEDDPDTIAAHYGRETSAYLESLPRRGLIDCYVEFLLNKVGAKSILEVGAGLKGTLAEELVETVRAVKNPVELGEYLERAALLLRLDESNLRRLLIAKGIDASKRSNRDERREDVDEADSVRTSEVPVSELSLIDRELLLAVMDKKDFLPSQALRDSDVCLGIHPSALRFIQGLAAIVVETEKSDDVAKKEKIKALLKQFGESWLHHWKIAYSMLEDKSVNLVDSFEQCKLSLKRNKYQHMMKELNREIALAATEEEKVPLVQEKMTLTRQINDLSGKG